MFSLEPRKVSREMLNLTNGGHSMVNRKSEDGAIYIYRWSITTRDGRVIRPKHGRPFRIRIK